MIINLIIITIVIVIVVIMVDIYGGFHRFRQTFLYLGIRYIDSVSIDSFSTGSLKTTYIFRQGKRNL